MADARDIAEQVRLLTDFQSSGNQTEFLQQTNQFLADAESFRRDFQAQPRTGSGGAARGLTASQALKQQEALAEQQAAQQLVEQGAVNEIDRLFRGLDLNPEQAFLARQGGELGATLNYLLQQEKDKAVKRAPQGADERTALLDRAIAKLTEEEDAFRAANPQAVDFRSKAGEAQDLATPDGFLGNLAKAATTGLAGIPGLLGIGASAVGLEGTGQALGGLASGIRDMAPTDIGSAAASAQAGDIQRRASLPEEDPDYLSIPQVISQTARLALTDGDFAADIGASTAGVVAGGGPVRAAASGAARLAGATGAAAQIAGTAAPAASLAGRAAQGAAATAPAIGVGLGSGVDETLTTPQAQLLAATGVASSGFAGLAGVLGGQTAEAALGGLGSRLPGAARLPGVNPRAVQPTEGLAQAGAAARARSAGSAALGGAAAESGQEFIEGAGESLARSAQQGFGELDGAALQQATVAGAAGAPLGALMGGPLGAAGSLSATGQQNRVNREQLADNTAALQQFSEQGRAQEAARVQATVAQNDAAARTRNEQVLNDERTAVDFRDARIGEVEQETAGFEQRRQAQDVVSARRAELNRALSEQVGTPITLTADTPIDQIGQFEPQVANFGNTLNPMNVLQGEPTPEQRQGFVSDLQALQGDEVSLRALYQNQSEQAPAYFLQAGEDAFVEAIQAIPDTGITIGQAATQVQRAMNAAGTAPEVLSEPVAQAQAAAAQQEESRAVSELAAQDQALQQGLDERGRQADTQVGRVFRRTRAERNRGLDSFTNSPQRLASLGLTETVLAADTGNATARAETVDLYNLMTSPEATSEQNADIFEALARDTAPEATPESEQFAQGFAARMAGTASRWRTPEQMVQAVRDYVTRYAPDAVRQDPAVAASLYDNQTDTEVSAGISTGYAPEVAELFESTDSGISLTLQGVRETQELAAQFSDRYVDLVAPEGNSLRPGVLQARDSLESIPEGPLSPAQAYQAASATAELQRLLDRPAREQEAIERSRRRATEASQAAGRSRRARANNAQLAERLEQTAPDPAPTPPSQGLNPDTLVDRFPTGNAIKPAARERIEGLTTPKGLADVHNLTAPERRQLTNTRPYGRARRAIKALLEKDSLSETEVTELAGAVDVVQKAVAAKKPDAGSTQVLPAEETGTTASNTNPLALSASITSAGAGPLGSPDRAGGTPAVAPVAPLPSLSSSLAGTEAGTLVASDIARMPSNEAPSLENPDSPIVDLPPSVSAAEVVPNRVEFNPATDPSLVDRRDVADVALPKRIDRSTLASETSFTDSQVRARKYVQVGFEGNANDNFSEQASQAVLRAYRRMIPRVAVVNAVGFSAVHSNGGVAVSGTETRAEASEQQLAHLISHEIGHASHSLLGDVVNQDASIRAELAPEGPVEQALYPGLREKVAQATGSDAEADPSFFNYVLSANEMLAELNALRFSSPDVAQRAAPALVARLESVQEAPNLVIPRSTFPSRFGAVRSENFLTLEARDGSTLRVKRRYSSLEARDYQDDSAREVIARGRQEFTFSGGSALARRALLVGGSRDRALVYLDRLQQANIKGISVEMLDRARSGVESLTLDTLPADRIRRSIASSARSVDTVRRPVPQGLLPDGVQAEAYRQFSTDELAASVAQLTSSWKRKPSFNIVATVDDLPPALQQGGLPVAGITDGRAAYLVAENISSEAQLLEVMTEELFHKGLARSLGGNYDAVLDRVFNKRGKVSGLLALADQYPVRGDFRADYQSVIAAAQRGEREAQRELTDEVLARVGQNVLNAPKSLAADVKAVTSRLKRYLKQFLPATWFDTVSDADLHLMVREANEAGREGEQGFSGPKRVRTNRATRANLVTEDAQGNRIVSNFFQPGLGDPTPTARQRLEVARNRATGVMQAARGRDLGNKIFNSTIWQGLMRNLANARVGAQRVEVELDRTSDADVSAMFDALKEVDLPPEIRKIVSRADNLTRQRDLLAINSAISVYTSRADALAKFKGPNMLQVNEQGQSLFEVVQDLNNAKMVLAARLNLTAEQASQTISQDLTARHAAERNDIAYLKSADLGRTANRQRDALFKTLNTGQNSAQTLQDIRDLVAENTAETSRASFVGSGMSDAQAAEIRAQVNASPEVAALYDAVAEATYAVQRGTNQIRRQTGSFSNSLQNVIDAYGWQNYVPLRGRGIDPDEELGDVFVSHYADNVFSSTFRAFEGRQSLAQDVTDSVYKAALSAVEQNAAQEFLDSVAAHMAAVDTVPGYQQAFAQDGSGGRLLAGVQETMDINSAQFKSLMAAKDPKRLVRYHPESSTDNVQLATVMTLESQEGADAVMGAKSVLAENLDSLMRGASVNGVGIHQVTQTLSSLKTWRNLPFIPFDALRNMFTLGYLSATEVGYTGFKRYLNQLTAPGTKDGNEIFNYVNLYYRNQFDEIEARVQSSGPGSTFSEVHEFFQLGGPTTQLAAIRDVVPGSLQSLGDIPGQGRAGRALEKVDTIFSVLNVTADTLSRLAFFKSLKAGGVPARVAAARAKNTANFEQRGTWSGPLSGLFEFFRATAVGATALINSTLNGKYGLETAAASFGAGASLYLLANMLAGQDEEGEDRMAEVNGKLYNNNFVFQYGDEKSDRLQMGLGFGPIAAAASSGIQAARFMLGHQSGNDTVNNITAAGFGQYQVVPSAGMSPLQDPVPFAANSLVPSVFKPIYEVSTNMSSLGIPVRSQYGPSDSGDMTDSFSGRYSSEAEMYDDISEGLRNSGFADLNPDNLRHLMRSYGGTMTYLVESLWENARAVTQDDEFTYKKKAGWYLARQFIGSEFSQTPSDFYNHFGRIEQLDKRAKEEERSGDLETAAQYRDSDLYRDSIEPYRAARREIDRINDEYRPILRLDATPVSEKRVIERERDRRRTEVYRRYLEAVQP